MKYALLAFLLIAGCSGGAGSDVGQSNMNRLATVEAGYGAAQQAALFYIHQPLCSDKVISNCVPANNVKIVQAADRSALAAIEGAHAAVKTNPAAPAASELINAAASAVAAMQKQVQK